MTRGQSERPGAHARRVGSTGGPCCKHCGEPLIGHGPRCADDFPGPLVPEALRYTKTDLRRARLRGIA
jgi:hypothetical protein